MTSSAGPGLRAVLLDFGGVLYRMPNPRWLPLLHRLMRRLGFAGETNHGLLEMMQTSPTESRLVMDVMTGATPEEEVWAEAARAWRISPERLARMRRGAYRPDRLSRGLLDAVQALRPRYKTALLTNAGSQFRETFVRIYDLEAYFDQVIISAEEGLAKPDPRIYRLAAGRLEVAPAEALLIDDLAENIAGAEAAGLRALLFSGPAETLRILRELAQD